MEASPPSDEGAWSDRLFLRSLNPMIVTDDERRFVDANPAACLFLRLTQEAICKLRIDDLTPLALRPNIDARWAQFLQAAPGAESLRWEFYMPDGTSIAAELSLVLGARPGRHLVIVLISPADELDEPLDRARAPDDDALTPREREILMLVARGNTGVQIADQLFLSPATVQTHMVNTLVKLKARNRAHGIAIALQSGVLDLDVALDE